MPCLPRGIRADEIVVSIKNGDNQPLKNPNFQWFSHETVLLMESSTVPENEIRIYYGSRGLRPPEYDIRKFASQFDGAKYQVWKPGAQSRNPDAETVSFAPGRLAAAALPYLLGITAFLLGILIFRSFKRIKEE